MNDKQFNLLYFMMFSIIVAIIMGSSWDSYLHYLNRKQIIEVVKSNNVNLSSEQIQGLINSKNERID
jgi:hypothetical protein